MPAILREHQLELLDANDETRSIVFGTEDTGYLTLTPPLWADGDARDSDVPRPQEDGRYFGRDLRGGKSVSFEIGVITDRLATASSNAHRTNVDYLDVLSSWWDDDLLRARPWDLAVLRTHVAGRTWRAYGRPRRFDPGSGLLTKQGYTPVVCDFAVIDNRVYSDDVEQISVGLVALPQGGLVAPLAAPLTTVAGTTGLQQAIIGGSKDTWPWVQFRGPVTNPRVQIGSLVVGLATTIAPGLSVTVDPRPWSRGVTRNDGANYAGSLSAEMSVLRDLRIRPGTHEVVYSGIDATGTSECVVSWRRARSRP